MPIFSVVIPTFNRRDRLLRAVGSVLSQSFRDYEIIVVDDGSTDGSAAALRGLSQGIRILTQRNQGPAAARNAGARAATGDYLAFLDSDDAWLPWTLEHYASLIREHARPAWLYSRGFVYANQAQSDVKSAGDPMATRFLHYIDGASRDGVLPLPTGVAIDREVFLRAGGFHEALHGPEDIDLWFRIGVIPGFVLVDRPATFVREVHDGSLGEHTEKSYRGLSEVIRRERAGVYPGDAEAAFVRRGVLTRQLMYFAAQYRRRGRPLLAARFYLEILRMQAEARFREPPFGGRRNRFLFSFPFFMAAPGLYESLKRAARRGEVETPPGAAAR